MAVDLKALNESQQNTREREKQGIAESPKGGGFSNLMGSTQEGERAYYVFKLVKKRKGRVYIDSICDNVLNPKTKRRERAYLLNGADSIWQSELIELLKDKEYVKKNRTSLFFEDGVMRIRAEDQNTLEYARVNKNNVGKNRSGSGKWDFFEYDPKEEEKEKLAKESKEIDMIIEAKQMPADKMKKLAAYFGVKFVDDLGMAVGEDGIRADLIRVAKRNPYEFEKHINSKEVEISWLVKRAIMDAKIDLTSGNAIWAGGKGFICKIPADRKHYEYLTEYAMTNSEEGKAFLQQLQQIVT